MCFKIFVDLIMILNCLRNIKYDEHQYEIYLYILFICTQRFYEICEEKKICYISNFVNLKYLIHEDILTFLIRLLTHSLLLIIFRCPKPWRRVILG